MLTMPPKWSYFTIIFYNFGLSLVKISILLLYLRVLRDLNYRKACYIVLSIVVAVSLWTTISSILFCVPLERNWDKRYVLTDPIIYMMST